MLHLREILCAFTFLTVVVNIFLTVHLRSQDIKQRTYSYIANDFPEFYPMPASDPIAMTTEESRHYAVSFPDALDEWATNSPVGYGYVRLGPSNRAFAIAMFHQLHCLHLMRAALDTQSPNMQGHMKHCLNYLRQFILCQPDLTLEDADVLDRDFEKDRVGATHMCRDWRVVYKEVETNWWTWDKIRPKSEK